jgi:hypothetical protein
MMRRQNGGKQGWQPRHLAARRKQLFLYATEGFKHMPWMPRYQTDIMAVAIAYAW